MTIFDYALIAILAASVLLGGWRGMVSEVLSLGAWIAAFFAARAWGEMVGSQLFSSYISQPFGQTVGGWIIVFVAALLVVAIFRGLLRKTLQAIGLGFLDRLLGMGFGAARGVLVILFLVAIGGMTHLPQQAWWQQSRLAPLAEQGVGYVKPWLPDDLAKHIAFADTLSQLAPLIPQVASPLVLPQAAPAAAQTTTSPAAPVTSVTPAASVPPAQPAPATSPAPPTPPKATAISSLPPESIPQRLPQPPVSK